MPECPNYCRILEQYACPQLHSPSTTASSVRPLVYPDHRTNFPHDVLQSRMARPRRRKRCLRSFQRGLRKAVSASFPPIGKATILTTIAQPPSSRHLGPVPSPAPYTSLATTSSSNSSSAVYVSAPVPPYPKSWMNDQIPSHRPCPQLILLSPLSIVHRLSSRVAD